MTPEFRRRKQLSKMDGRMDGFGELNVSAVVGVR